MAEKNYLITYDMSNDKRRNRIVKILMNYAYRVQYSVFELSVPDNIIVKIKKEINRIINTDEDSVFIYELCQTDWNKRIKLGINKSEENIYEKSFAII